MSHRLTLPVLALIASCFAFAQSAPPNDYSKPEPFRPGEIAKVEFTLPDICHVWRRGHRLMVQIQSSWFPLVDRNPQQYVDIYQAKDSDFIAATQHIHHDHAHPSSLRM